MNNCTFLGNLTRDPETRQAGNSTVTSFGIAINRRYKTANGEQRDETTFLDLEAWAGGGEAIQKKFKKGMKILVDCSAKTDTWEDKKTGEKRNKIKFRVNEFYYVDSSGKKVEDDAPAADPVEDETHDDSEDDEPF